MVSSLYSHLKEGVFWKTWNSHKPASKNVFDQSTENISFVKKLEAVFRPEEKAMDCNFQPRFYFFDLQDLE